MPTPTVPTTTAATPGLTPTQAVDLVDAIVCAVDLGRSHEVERVRGALVPLGLDRVFVDELRLNGTWSVEAAVFDVEVAF